MMPGGWGSWNLIGWLIIFTAAVIGMAAAWLAVMFKAQEWWARRQARLAKRRQDAACEMDNHVRPLDRGWETERYDDPARGGVPCTRQRALYRCRNCGEVVERGAWKT